ncbi:hypothetical protein B2I21_33975 [Chryseobacterium mucoviscidosis]|uniref:hypothetical protein n=1 Tax=Paenibacillus sp. 11B TaxID=3060965 RepID=UPI0009A39E98|nr:hypothetical protein [Paenibacillus sp. 11B]MDN8590396.1 hypothetical protein [Paenibacillus sp. 11B]OPG94264.1 hypothetical protein B2I21_33975 [Chryseobacterium mucoviscidosis]
MKPELHTSSEAELEHRQMGYRRFTAIWKGALCLLFLLLCVTLLWIIYDERAGQLETLYYSIAAILGMWFIGPLFFMFLSRAIASSTVLLSWNDEGLHTLKRTIPWDEIRKIELGSPAFSKWILSSSPMIAMYLKDGTRHHIQTDHLLTKKELSRAVVLLQETLREKQQQDL